MRVCARKCERNEHKEQGREKLSEKGEMGSKKGRKERVRGVLLKRRRIQGGMSLCVTACVNCACSYLHTSGSGRK